MWFFWKAELENSPLSAFDVEVTVGRVLETSRRPSYLPAAFSPLCLSVCLRPTSLQDIVFDRSIFFQADLIAKIEKSLLLEKPIRLV